MDELVKEDTDNYNKLSQYKQLYKPRCMYAQWCRSLQRDGLLEQVAISFPGIFSRVQGSNLHLPHWQAGSLTS